jgi:hypothetical protein
VLGSGISAYEGRPVIASGKHTPRPCPQPPQKREGTHSGHRSACSGGTRLAVVITCVERKEGSMQ